mmetsp:Transcript_48348/g.111936  ORF Transcript_48348/g.111936 Transcript_48348/m.111936 type:complete len:291 (-) Transcript_48348:140-1012(-)
MSSGMLATMCHFAPTALQPPAPVVILGPGSLDLRLVTAKVAARAGFRTSVLSTPQQQYSTRRWMYGKDYAEGGSDDAENVQLRIEPSAIADAVKEASAICLVCDTAPLPDSSLGSLLDAAEAVQRFVLVSRMGVTHAKAGPFGLGKGDVELLQGEQRLRDAAAAGGFDLSIVRVGTLKGGGPGKAELGLSKAYYDSIYELETALVTQSYDKFTLGAKCAAGDPIDMANPIMAMAYRGSFDPRNDETSRVVAARAVVGMLRHPAAVEFSLSSAKGEMPPTEGQWTRMFNEL